MVLDEFAVLGDAISTFGQDYQKIKAVEEMSELQKELCKSLAGADNMAEIAEEIADVQIMLEQMTMIYSCAGRVKAIRASKLRRLEQRVQDAIMERAAEQAADPEVDSELFLV